MTPHLLPQGRPLMLIEFDCRREFEEISHMGVDIVTLSVDYRPNHLAVFVHYKSRMECDYFANWDEFCAWKAQRAIIHEKFEL